MTNRRKAIFTFVFASWTDFAVSPVALWLMGKDSRTAPYAWYTCLFFIAKAVVQGFYALDRLYSNPNKKDSGGQI